MTKKLITRIKGGLGNQLFCYAIARRIALVNNAELLIDNVSGFTYDHEYRRKYALDTFHIPAPKASYFERQEPLGRLRRKLLTIYSRRQPLHKRPYILQEGVQFDPQILNLNLTNAITYFDGFGQSEDYFSDIESLIRKDLTFKAPQDAKNQELSLEIRSCESVAVHVRWFNLDKDNYLSQASDEYYRKALEEIRKSIKSPHLFIFSDQSEETINRFKFLNKDLPVTFVTNNQGDDMAYADLWLMSLCKHFVIANSTFSWWGAWLGEQKGISHVFAPKFFIEPTNNVTAWGFDHLLPSRWNLL